MRPVSWQDALDVILSNETNRAAGIDGVNCDLVRLLVEDSLIEKEPTTLLKIIVLLVNESLLKVAVLQSRGARPLSQ